LTSEGVMSQWSTVRHSRKQWTPTAPQRAEQHRYPRQQLARGTPERDRATTARKQAQARRRQREAQSQGLAVQRQVDLGFLALQLG